MPPQLRVFVSALAACSAAACLLSPAEARAQQSLDQAFADGLSLLRFEPSPAGDRFYVVPEGAVPAGEPGIRGQLLGHYTLRPSLTRTDNVTGRDRDLVSKQFFLHPGLSYAPTRWLLAHVELPMALSQSGEGPNAPESPAVGDLRLGARVGIVGDEHAAFALAPGLDAWLPIGSQRNLVGDGAFRILPRVNVSGEILPFAYGATVGYQFREHVETGSLEVGDSLVFGVAAGLVLFDEALTVGPEFHAAWLTESETDAFASRTSPMELLFGARLRVGDVTFGGGVGPSLSEAPGVAPRAVFSLAYAPRTPAPKDDAPPPPSDHDNDGVWDNDDACPDQAGPSRPDPGRSGCPDPVDEPAAVVANQPVEQAPPEPTGADSDSDGVPDSADACPKQPGVSSVDAEQNGCPAEADADGDGVPDVRDACPKEPGTKSSDAKTSGCAAKVDAAKLQDKAEITFSGYRSLPGGGGVVFVEMTDPVAVEVSRSGQVIEYKLVGASVPLKNNKNPLLLRDFSASAMTAVLVPDKKAVKLVITLRGAVSPSHRMVPRGKGAALEVELPSPATSPSR